MQSKSTTYFIDLLRPDEVRAAHQLLLSNFPREEVLSLSRLATRFEQAPSLSLGLFLPLHGASHAMSTSPNDSPRRLVAFASATATPAPIMQSVFGSSRSPYAHVVCIHDFCVDRSFRRHGYGRRLLHEFIARIQNQTTQGNVVAGQMYDVISVVCPEKRISFFKQFGFTVQSVSYISRGIDPWFEMRRFVHMDIDHSQDTSFIQDDPDYLSMSTQTLSSITATSVSPVYPLSLTNSHTGSDQDYATLANMSHPGMGAAVSTSPLAMTPTSPTGHMAHDQMMAMLMNKATLSDGAARDLGLPHTSQPKTNPGMPFEKIFGQAIAGKTAAENFRTALISRLVDRNLGLNMHKLFCPNEACDCVLLGRQKAEWLVRETGPLTETVPTTEDDASPESSHTAEKANAPWMNSLFQSSSTVDTIGPLRGFWHVPGPMGFDNVAFSRDVEWHVPNRSAAVTSNARSNSQSSNDDMGSSKPRKRSFRERGNSFGSLRNTFRPLEPISSHPVKDTVDDNRLDVMPGEIRHVKYILCPDCGCGPLGFLIHPREGELASDPLKQAECYLAAFRVRYDV
ncbi:acyl- n-acyltransferase [Malassezia pachydermatis]|uniref:Acyl-n-acyltransferase n=1 Tax=Malassezia pachydermatis TaxID=77020 RepID=A0A0M8MTN7_9BASI|nr:acyl- n-acyltransferase [Malassezia pachydermatis]KOS13381.1 acyl- n-acyltransferase [Malassezia pachydermatis]